MSDRVEDTDELLELVVEYNELKQVAAEIGVDGTVAEAVTAVREDGSALGAVEAGEQRRGRSRRGSDGQRTGSGELGDRVLAAVRAEPGKTVADYAAILGMPATTLYRPVRQLTTDGALLKRARHLFPA